MTTQGRRPFGLVWTVISTASFRTVISTASVRRSCHPSRVFDRLMAHRSVESNRGPSPITGFIGCRDGLFKLPAICTSGRVLPGTRHWRVTAGPSRSMYGLVTFVTTLGPSGQWPPTSSPTSRFVVTSSSSGTQPTVLVCWATPDRRPCRRRHRRPRGRSSSMMLAISRARRRPEPRAEQARLLRASLPPQ